VGHPGRGDQGPSILLNRAPTLHRLAFRGLSGAGGGQAIKIHPLVCTASMRTSTATRWRCTSRSRRRRRSSVGADAGVAQHPVAASASHHRAHAGHGAGHLLPDQGKVNAIGEGRVFANIEEVFMALEAKQIETLTPIRLRYTGPVLDMTTATTTRT